MTSTAPLRRAQYLLGVLLVLMVATALAMSACGDDDGGDGGGGAADLPTLPEVVTADLQEAAETAGCELLDPRHEGSDHVDTAVEYDANPPTSGPHNPTPADDGDYSGEEPPATEASVHSLEHGRINVQYKPGLPQAKIDQLRAFFAERDGYHMLLFENQTDMTYEVAATAWDHALVCDRMTDEVFDALRAFRDTYTDQGPEIVP